MTVWDLFFHYNNGVQGVLYSKVINYEKAYSEEKMVPDKYETLTCFCPKGEILGRADTNAGR